jgi:hypothetical protein
MPVDVNALSDMVILAVQTTIGPLTERLAKAEAQVEMLKAANASLTELRDRLVTVESRQPVPGPAGKDGRDGKDASELPLDDFRKDIAALSERVAVVEVLNPVPGPAGKDGKDGRDGSDAAVGDIVKDIMALRERVAVAEVVKGVPGPAGKDGKDGADGLGFEDLNVVQIDERSFVIRAAKGERVKELGTLTFPVEIYRGVYVDGQSYDRGDGVTWGGSEWHCNETTKTKPGDGSKAWTLKVKRGRDGKDGRDAVELPVVTVGARG